MFKCIDKKRKRTDTKEYLLNNNKTAEYKTDFDFLQDLIKERSRELQKELISKTLTLQPITYRTRYDINSQKERNIATQSIKQQICDYIAIECLTPFFGYIGEYQIAGIKGRGTSYGIKALKKWLRNGRMKYFCKMDIRKCYESIDRNKLMNFLRKHIKNDNLLWLVKTLISTYKQGLSIGSLLSQYLCNLYLGQLYHEISENMYRYRKGKRISLVKHTLFQMDDILIIGTNKKDLERAVELIKVKLNEMSLRLKGESRVYEILQGREKLNNGKRFVDIIGYRFYGYNVKVTARRKTYKHYRRCYLRLCKGERINIYRARRFVGLYGRLIATNRNKIVNHNKLFDSARSVIGSYDKSKIYNRTAGNNNQVA